jgi:hypothetical protein
MERKSGGGMKSTSCIKKDVQPVIRYIERKVIYPCTIKINNAIYSHQSLKEHLGFNVQVINGQNQLRVYDAKRNFICIAKKSINLPKQIKTARNTGGEKWEG